MPSVHTPERSLGERVTARRVDSRKWVGSWCQNAGKRPEQCRGDCGQLFLPTANDILDDYSNFTSASELLLTNTASVIIY